MKPEPFAAYLWMLASAGTFTVMGVIAHALAGRCPWPVVALARTMLAFFFAVLLAYRGNVQLAVWRPGSLWMRSIAGSCSLLLTFYALPRLPIATTLTLTNMSPIWIALLSWPMLGHRPSAGVWFAAVTGVCGVFLIQRPEASGETAAAVAAALASGCTAV